MTQKRQPYDSSLKSLLQEDAERILRRLNRFDKLLEEDERVIELMTEHEARGRIAGKMELLATIIEARFPALVDEARHKLRYVKQPKEFDTLAKLVVKAPMKMRFDGYWIR